jgi:TonB family protein
MMKLNSKSHEVFQNGRSAKIPDVHRCISAGSMTLFRPRFFWLLSLLFHTSLCATAFFLNFSRLDHPTRQVEVCTITDVILHCEFVTLPQETPSEAKPEIKAQALRDFSPTTDEVEYRDDWKQVLERMNEAACDQEPDSKTIERLNEQTDIPQGVRCGDRDAGGGSTDDEPASLLGIGEGSIDWSRKLCRNHVSGTGKGTGTGSGVGDGEGLGAGFAGSGQGVAEGLPSGTGTKQSRGGTNRAPVAENISGGDYPIKARKELREGVVLLRIKVLEDGKLGKVELAHTSGSSDLDAAALKAAVKWRFKPALHDGEIVAAWLEVPVRYILKDN